MQNERTSLIEGVIWKNLLFFALPLFLGNVFQQLYNTADTLIVGRFLDKSALAAVSSSGSLIFTLVGFFSGISMGAGVVIARHFGAKDQEALEKAVHTDVAFGLIVGVGLTIVGVVCTPTILVWMGTPENVLPNSISYFRVYFLGAIFVVMYNILVGILQAVGDSRHPLYYLIASSLTNIVLDLVFVGGFGWGVWSAALATTISQGLSALLSFRRLVRCTGVYRLNVRRIRIDRRSLGDIIRMGVPSGLQNSITSIANVVVQTNINHFGDAAMAGCGSYFKVEGFGFLPITCFAMAMATFVGQNLGAQEYERAQKGVRFGLICSVSLAQVVGILIWIFAPQLIGLFSSDPEIIAFGVRQARTEAFFYGVLAISHCSAGILRGAGRATVPMFTMIGAWCVFRITYITVLMHFFPYIEVVFSAYPVTWIIASTILVVYLLRADWLHSFDRMDLRHG